MSWKVLYSEQAPWKVGERDTDRDARIEAADAVDPRDLYPGSCPGQVISVIPADREYSPGDLVDPSRAVVELELAAEDLVALRSRTSRIGGDLRPAAVTFDEKHGAVGPELKRRFPLDFLVRKREEEEARLAAEERNRQAELDWQAELETWRESLAEAVELGAVFDTPAPARPPLEPLPEPSFALTAAKLGRLLPPTLVHSGAGLYRVDATGSTHNDTIAGFAENLCLQSEDFSTSWQIYLASLSVATDQVAGPFTGTLADKIAETAVTQYHAIAAPTTLVNGVQYTFSVYIKNGTRRWLLMSDNVPATSAAWFDLQNGVVGTVSGTESPTADIEDVGDGWYRCSITMTKSGVGPPFLIFARSDGDYASYAGDTAQYFYTYGAQIEASATPDEYIRTLTTSMHAVLLTTGGLTEDERNGEVLISGGNSYPVIKAYPAQANVVGDPTGEAGALTISPYTTIQSALDQLWTDQGAATFTASQYIRIFAGTYDENVIPNSSLNPDEEEGYALIIEGDPADDRANISIAPSGGTYALTLNAAYTSIVRHLTVAGTPGTGMVTVASSVSRYSRIEDCAISGAKTGIRAYYGLVITDSVLTLSANVTGIYIDTGDNLDIQRCTFVGPGSGTSTQYAVYAHTGPCNVEASVFSGWRYASGGNAATVPVNVRAFRGCTFYDCTYALLVNRAQSPEIVLIDCIFKDVDYPILVNANNWPEETATRMGNVFLLRNNCIHGDTAFAYDGITTKTYTEFTAFNQVDASGDLDDTDPLLTDPGAGDFSLQAASPCKWTGHGSGVISDYLGTAFDPFTPDIGAWSSGVLAPWTPTPPPILTVPTPSGTTITVTLAGSADRYRTRLSKADGTEVEEKSRAGAGDVAFAGNTEGTHYRLLAWAVTGADVVQGEPSIIHDAYVANASAQTASGPISLPIENLRILLSNSDDFQSFVGAGDAAGALGSIHYPYQDKDEYVRPVALIEGAESWNSRQPALETVQIFLHDGEMALTIERDVDSAYQAGGKERDAYLTFTNVVGAIVSDLESGAISYLDVRAIRIVEKPRRVARTEKAQGRDYYSVTLAVEWGG